MIKCLLTELGRAGREIFGSWSRRMDLAAFSPYAMTESQIFFRLARPNSVNKYIKWRAREIKKRK